MALQDRCRRRHVDQLDPFVDVQHVPRRRAAAEREAVRQATCATTGRACRIDRQHLVECSFGSALACAPAARGRADRGRRRSRRDGTCSAARSTSLGSSTSRPLIPLCRFSFSRSCDDVGIVVRSRPPGAGRVATDQVVVLRRGLDVGRRAAFRDRADCCSSSGSRSCSRTRWVEQRSANRGGSVALGCQSWACAVMRPTITNVSERRRIGTRRGH